MRIKLGLLILVMIVAIGSTHGDNGKYGFTGFFQETTLADFSKHAEARSLDYTLDEGNSNKVKALAVGAKKFTAPVSPYSPHFVYYAYNLIAMDQWWFGIIVVNSDDISHLITVKIEVTGVMETEIEQEFTIEPHTAKLFSAETELPHKIGTFHSKGTVSGAGINSSSVKSKLFIYDTL
jgi:hypothetical protein